MKTGRLLKFHRPGGDVQAYLYQEGGVFRASVFVLGPSGRKDEPLQILTGPSESAVESELRAWVESHFPPPAK
ncbi:MAG TPA: hypothetical protein VFE68_04430 [Vicinamibacteria bacterium]|nr:hypothetical protein [Vicinamibacteria bacterium]